MSAQGENKITLDGTGLGLGSAAEVPFDEPIRRVTGPAPRETTSSKRSVSGAHPRREAMMDSLAYRPTLLDAAAFDAAAFDNGALDAAAVDAAALDAATLDAEELDVDDPANEHAKFVAGAAASMNVSERTAILSASRSRTTYPVKDGPFEERQLDGKGPMNSGKIPQDTTSRDTLRDAVRMSSGYYSRTDSQVEAVEIPRAPRVPKIEDIDGPLPKTPTSKPVTVRRDSSGARRVMIAAALRRQADAWLETGSLELPTTASPRHARAKQRALLVALLMEPGFDRMPLGLQQRATWLFRSGWALGSGERDADDCAACLGFEPLAEIRTNLVLAIEAALPEHLMTAPPPSSQRPESLRPAAAAAERPTSRPPKGQAPTSRPPAQTASATARTTRPPARSRGE